MGSISAGIPKFADTVLKPFRSSLRYCGFPEVADSLELSTRRKAGHSTSGFLGKVQEFFTNLRNSIIEAFGGNKTKKSSTQHGSGSWLLGGTALASTALAVTYSDQIMASVRSQFQKWGWIEADKRMSRQFLSGQATANASKSGGWFKYAALVVLVPAALLAHHANPGWFEKLLKQSKKGLEADRTASTAAVLAESKGAVSKEEEVLVPPPSKPALVPPTFTPPPSKPPRSSSSSSAFTVPLLPPPTPINWTPSMEILEKTPAGTTISTEKLFTAKPHKINIQQPSGTNICHTLSGIVSILQHPNAHEMLPVMERFKHPTEGLGVNVHLPSRTQPVFVSDAELQAAQAVKSDNIGVQLLLQAHLKNPDFLALINSRLASAQAQVEAKELAVTTAKNELENARTAFGNAAASGGDIHESISQRLEAAESKLIKEEADLETNKRSLENIQNGQRNPSTFQLDAQESLQLMFGKGDDKIVSSEELVLHNPGDGAERRWIHDWEKPLPLPRGIVPLAERDWHNPAVKADELLTYLKMQRDNPTELGILTAIHEGGGHYYSVLPHTLREAGGTHFITLHDGFNGGNAERGFFETSLDDLKDMYHLTGRQFAPRPQ